MTENTIPFDELMQQVLEQLKIKAIWIQPWRFIDEPTIVSMYLSINLVQIFIQKKLVKSSFIARVFVSIPLLLMLVQLDGWMTTLTANRIDVIMTFHPRK